MPRSLTTTIIVDRVYRSNRPANGKPEGIFYLIKAMLPGGLVTIVGFNPNAPLRKFNNRTIQAKSLAVHALDLVPYADEPPLLQSEEGKRLAAQRAAAPPPPTQKLIEVVSSDRLARGVMREIERLFNSSADGSRLLPKKDLLPLASALIDLGVDLTRAVRAQDPSEAISLGIE